VLADLFIYSDVYLQTTRKLYTRLFKTKTKLY